ncbi:MAG: VOC family protein [Bryobacteraceae bacterium]|nr:VOC family protein [Bryobacteraceae bacterium]
MTIPIESMSPLLQVFDMPTSLAFYRKLGFVVTESAPPATDECDWAMLERDGMTIMLNTAYESDSRPPSPDPARVEAHEDTSIYFGCPDVDSAYRHLLAQGIAADPPKIAPYGMKQLYVKDPDGYSLCFQWPAQT